MSKRQRSGFNGELRADAVRGALKSVSCSSLSYKEWLQVGMSMKHEGLSASEFSLWSAEDKTRHKAGEPEKQWLAFNGAQVASATGDYIIKLALEKGQPHEAGAAAAGSGGGPLPSSGGPDEKELLSDCLDALYYPDEPVGYLTEGMAKLAPGGRPGPEGGVCIGEPWQIKTMGLALGGAWFIANPLDGNGPGAGNVAEFRWLLVAQAEGTEEEQLKAIKGSFAPTALIARGAAPNSTQAFVAIGAETAEEYKARSEAAFRRLEAAGAKPDRAAGGANCLAKMPSAAKDLLFIDYSVIGNASGAFSAWADSAAAMPIPEDARALVDSPPPLAEELIEGVLRVGHKMILTGPSKAGKSFFLIQLACCIANGIPFLGKKTKKSKVLYINLELDRASCIDRFSKVSGELGVQIPPGSVDIWNLRGKALQMSALAGEIIRLAPKGKYGLIIIDPLYKAMEGDENSAGDMAALCNNFDLIAEWTGASVIYSHHHSKAAMGYADSMSRSSGSGVFARDPDAIADLSELEAPEAAVDAFCNQLRLEKMQEWANKRNIPYPEGITDSSSLLAAIKKESGQEEGRGLDRLAGDWGRMAGAASAWCGDISVREFAKPGCIYVFFCYPTHRLAEGLEGAELKSRASGQKGLAKANSEKAARRDENVKRIPSLVSELEAQNGKATINDIMEEFDVQERAARSYLYDAGYAVKKGEVVKKEDALKNDDFLSGLPF